MTNPNFTYDEFASRSGVALHDFIEPKLAVVNYRPTQADAERMLSEHAGYDEFHLVYALLLCFRVLPEKVLQILPPYLLHPDASVATTALNLLSCADRDALGVDVMGQIREIQNQHPDNQVVANLLARFGEKL